MKSVKSECLDRLILFGEQSLRYVLREYLAHYHAERNHQGVGNVLLFPDERETREQGPVVKAERIGGLLKIVAARRALSSRWLAVSLRSALPSSCLSRPPAVR